NGNAIWDNGITIIGSPTSGQGGGCTSVYEPHDMYKGDFARVFMYMFTIYDDISWQNATNSGDGRGRMYTYTGGVAELQPWAYNLMLAWNVADPVSEKEVNRNNGVQKEQGNRNPFIDLPDLGDYIWGSKKNEVYHVEGAHTPEPGPDDPNQDDPNQDDPKPDDPVNPDLEGKYILVENQSDIIDGGEYLIVSPKTSLALSVTLGSNSTSMSPTGSTSISDKVIEQAPEGAAHIRLESTGNAYRLHLYDLEGKERGYLASSKAKDLHIAANPDEAGTEATVKVNGGDTTISYGSAGYLQYNSSAKMWRTYASGQEDPMLYKFVPTNVTSSITQPVDVPFRVIVNGNNIEAPEGSMIFDLSGRRVNGENLQNGVYIIVSPQKNKTVKAMVRF
ncbi:MAG: endonuclease, partial [Muribaculaceae bacterium]|nr:endonuclease [Muribaculaceae bacterium]